MRAFFDLFHPSTRSPPQLKVARSLLDRPVAKENLDAKTVDACRRGDRVALEEVFRAEAGYLERQIARLVGPGADVEDLLQATFLAAMGAFRRFRGEASVRTWLTRIAVRVVQGYLRRPEHSRRASLELVADTLSVPGPSLDSTLDARKKLARLYGHLSAVGPKKRIAFLLHVVEGRSMEEVAALMGASVVATKSRVFWARRMLLSRARRDPALRDLVPIEETQR